MMTHSLAVEVPPVPRHEGRREDAQGVDGGAVVGKEQHWRVEFTRT